MKVGFIGLGNIGMLMAKTLLRGGIDLTVHNRSQGKVEEMVALGASRASSTAEITRATDMVLTCLPDVPTVEEIFLGSEGIIANARDGQILVDHSTVDPGTSKKIAAAAEARGASFLDAPIGGGSPQAAVDGTLTIMVGGARDSYEQAMPVFQVMGKTIPHMGPSGAGAAMTVVSNLMVGINSAGAAEALLLATKFGIDPQLFLETAATNAGNSFMLSYLGPTMVSRDFSDPGNKTRPTLRLLVKDQELANATASEVGLSLLAGKGALKIFQAALDYGSAEDDIASILLAVENLTQG
jgi:3-hydroxyisobutyrate dehydrogenase-like beta-hydroxyacid dehydrogenase